MLCKRYVRHAEDLAEAGQNVRLHVQLCAMIPDTFPRRDAGISQRQIHVRRLTSRPGQQAQLLDLLKVVYGELSSLQSVLAPSRHFWLSLTLTSLPLTTLESGSAFISQ